MGLVQVGRVIAHAPVTRSKHDETAAPNDTSARACGRHVLPIVFIIPRRWFSRYGLPSVIGCYLVHAKTRRLTRLFHTLRYLKLRQIVYRIGYRIVAVKPRHSGPVALVPRATPWPGDSFMQPTTNDGRHFRLLGEDGQVDANWRPAGKAKLWLYNLHYLDDLHAHDAPRRNAVHVQMVNDWIAANPPAGGDGWEPYPLSLRIVNLIKWISRQEHIDARWLSSFALQTDALYRQREFHILGNHLFVNAKALLFAGTALRTRAAAKWLRAGLDILDNEVAEQFLSDGAHFELSPMYHATMLWDLCDLVMLARWTRHPDLQDREPQWREVIAKGIEWLRAMVHPDGEISFFNDATLDIAPTSAQLERYGAMLACLPPAQDTRTQRGWETQHHRASGYVTIDAVQHAHRALLDLARVGPDYQPGHAHADTLSFELSLFGQRLFVNSGISQYGQDARRQQQRSTAAHNTVEIDHLDSSEVWGGFRVGQRARPSQVTVASAGQDVRVTGEHDGYRRLKGRVQVYREWLFGEGHMTVTDRLRGTWTVARSRLYCHPDVNVEQLSDTQWALSGITDTPLRLSIDGARSVTVVPSTWHPRFGASIPNQCIEIDFGGPTVRTSLHWDLA